MTRSSSSIFFSTATATTEIYTLSLHDALPIFSQGRVFRLQKSGSECRSTAASRRGISRAIARHLSTSRHMRSEEHTSELQSHSDLVCRLLLEKKNKMV